MSLHRTGQWYKKIRGKFYYFGTDKDAAIRAYEEQATYLHTGKGYSPADRDNLTLLALCNLYLSHQESRLNGGEIGHQHFCDQRDRLRTFVKYIGPTRRASEIVTLDLQNYRAKRINDGRQPNTINNDLATIKALFHWAEGNEVLEQGPKLRAVKQVKARKSRRDGQRAQAEARQTFTVEQIRLLLDHATVQMRAMILLGLNCAFGCTDVAELRWDDIDFENSMASLPRGKTGALNPPLWLQTLEALKAIPGGVIWYSIRAKVIHLSGIIPRAVVT